jgi:hypothetical protein
VAAEKAELESIEFVAVTRTWIVEPTSAAASREVCAAAPAMSPQLEPAASQWRHWYA